jgi:signal transduction histidine kinase
MINASIFEVIALFALGLLVCLPALRKYLPTFQRQPEPDDAATPRARFEPSSARKLPLPVHHPHPPLAAHPLPDAVYDDDMPVFAGGVAASYDDMEEDEAEEGVLPLAEALLRGERVASRSRAERVRGAATSVVATAPPLKDEVPAPPKEPFKVLFVDGRDKFRTNMLLKLARSGHRVFPVANGRDALDVFTREKTDLVQIHRDSLCEIGPEFVRRIRATAPHVPILVHVGKHGTADIAPLRHGVDVTLVASAGDDADLLLDMIECSLAASRSIRRVRDDQEVRSTILSELCYNLRTSLDVISGYTDMLSDQPDLSPFKDMLESMRASTSSATVHMQSCVDVALDAPESVRRERVDLSTLSEKLRRLVSRQIGTHPLRLTTTGPMSGSALFTDGEKLLSILSHVITDAIKFTPTGEINIAVRSQPDHTDFVVTDAGPGISADAPMPFAPVPPPGGGDGASPSAVGLAIAERLSQSIGATLTGTCGEGGAAAFTISVPGKLLTPSSGHAGSPTLH